MRSTPQRGIRTVSDSRNSAVAHALLRIARFRVLQPNTSAHKVGAVCRSLHAKSVARSPACKAARAITFSRLCPAKASATFTNTGTAAGLARLSGFSQSKVRRRAGVSSAFIQRDRFPTVKIYQGFLPTPVGVDRGPPRVHIQANSKSGPKTTERLE